MNVQLHFYKQLVLEVNTFTQTETCALGKPFYIPVKLYCHVSAPEQEVTSRNRKYKYGRVYMR